jgi:hypothetical protein
MSVVFDLLLSNPIAQGVGAALVAALGWFLNNKLQQRKGRRKAEKAARADDVAAASEINRRAADAKRLRKPTGKQSRG